MGKKIEIKNFGYEVVHKSHQIDRIGGNNIMTMFNVRATDVYILMPCGRVNNVAPFATTVTITDVISCSTDTEVKSVKRKLQPLLSRIDFTSIPIDEIVSLYIDLHKKDDQGAATPMAHIQYVARTDMTVADVPLKPKFDDDIVQKAKKGKKKDKKKSKK